MIGSFPIPSSAFHGLMPAFQGFVLAPPSMGTTEVLNGFQMPLLSMYYKEIKVTEGGCSKERCSVDLRKLGTSPGPWYITWPTLCGDLACMNKVSTFFLPKLTIRNCSRIPSAFSPSPPAQIDRLQSTWIASTPSSQTC